MGIYGAFHLFEIAPPVSSSEHFHAHARQAEGLKGDFVVVLFRAFGFRQKILKHCGFCPVQARLALAKNLYDPEPNKRACDRMCLLVAQSFTGFRRVSVTQEICGVGR